MPHSDSIGNLAKAIAAAQAELKPVKKDTINPFFGKKYADLAAVWEALKPFHAHGIAITQLPFDAGEGMVGIATQLTHESGEWISGSLALPVSKDDAQGVGSAITYCRRYSLGCMTGVVTEEDDDGNSASQAKPAPAQNYQKNKAANSKKIAELRVEQDGQPGGALGGNGGKGMGSPPITPPDSASPAPSSISDATWAAFVEYMGDDPERTNVGKQLKAVLKIGTVADLRGLGRSHFITEFQKSCQETGVPCEQWI